MIRLLIFLVALTPCAALAQSTAQEEADKGFLVNLIEDNLSDDTTAVSINGFQGALSSQASLTSLAVADTGGIWLTLEGVTLDWNRSALFRGAIDVTQLTAERITLVRPPHSEAQAPSPEASPFALPDLPVSIELDQLDVGEIILGPAILGEEVTLNLQGSASLSGGEGTVDIAAKRLGPKAGKFLISGNYSNETRLLDLMLDLSEDAGGLIAAGLDIPGAPSLGLTVNGAGSIDKYTANIALATEGQDRASGQFNIRRDASGAAYVLNLDGDVSPLFTPEYRGFFGEDAALNATVRTPANGDVLVEAFDLTTQSVALTGSADIAASGWPRRLSIQGRIADPGGDIVLLPLGGPKTYVDHATISLEFDEEQSDEWSTTIDLTGLDRPGLYLSSVTINGGGIIAHDDGPSQGAFTGDLTYRANGLELDDAGLGDALGDVISGQIALERSEGDATHITRATLTGPGIEMLADAQIAGPKGRFETRSNILLTVDALERFSTLAGRDLSGSGDLAIGSTITPLDGLFDVIVAGTTHDLSIGIPQLDATFQGHGTIAAAAQRNTEGTRLSGLSVKTDMAELTASANLTSGASTLRAALNVHEARLIEPTLSGPMSLTIGANRDVKGITDITAQMNGTDIDADAALQLNPTPDGQTTNFAVTVDAADLSRLTALLERDLGGAARVTARGVLLADQRRFDVDIAGKTRDLRTGIAQLDPLLAGDGNFSGSIARLAKDLFRIKDLEIETPQAQITADGKGGLAGPATLTAQADVTDTRALGSGLSGAATAQVQIDRGTDEVATVTLTARAQDTDIALTADVAPPDQGYEITGVLSANVGNLSAFRTLIGQPVSGQVAVQANGSLMPDLSAFDAVITGQSHNLGLGQPIVDKILAGTGHIDAAARLIDGSLHVSRLHVSTPQASLSGTLDGKGGAGAGHFDARLNNIGLLTDQLSGPVTAQGTASLTPQGIWVIDAAAQGPGGIGAHAAGSYNPSGTVNLNIDGTAPLGIANQALEPRRLTGLAQIDLAVRGKPGLDALSGRIDLSDARLAAPTLGQALSNIQGGVALANGQATVAISADVESGGSLSVAGPVTLTGTNDADLTVRINDVILRDPKLYETSVSGQITATGSLQGDALIAGQLNLGVTEIRVPSSSIGVLGDLPDVTHVGASTAVQQTLNRADAGPKDTGASQGTGPTYPLDITINAPSRIFVRGRGVDAELGGSLRIAGTSKAVVPSGLFELVRGRIDILQQRFELSEGSASLQGDFIPVIRLVATTQSATGTTVRIIVEGPATEPEVRFESTPELPQDEVLSQLIFGRDLASISPLQAVQLAAAVATLAGRGGGGLVDTFRQGIGVDDLDITTDEDGNAAVRAGKYLSENVYTDVTVSSDGSTDININLDLSNDFTAKGSVGTDGETSIGVFFEKDY